ncbi:reverse transcriptase family protein [Pseudomonas sp. ZM23]|uniref:Reverse transcriptase family protein n=1 Tax=Pseudomonas triclosanedens TaxID=2961893 RepID=A0ABY6ZTT6_9PSED|nr:reverse transcriptase family protein [Pseudomonas triclosanedens]MCP8467207.1 reverse transcriptase family protein [Pseudomonas triclosanedens]MCP8472534.1 reverse transcriptase family protein [Pseudomonas triclosanedens]WAI47771.1 reverse transcriptase family protein [Pseudomonas triclosanedens]
MDEFDFVKLTENSISSLANLASALRIEEQLLYQALNLPADQRYTPHRLHGGDRLVYRPHSLIRKIQRKIKKSILAELVRYPQYLYGSISDPDFPRDYISCVKVHCLSKSVLKIDITKFFDHIESSVVEDVFSDFFSFSPEVSDALTDICTLNGFVPQGASTSSHLANLCFYKEEPRLARQLSREGLKYTRLVDDITVSSIRANYDFSRVESRIRGMIEGKGLSLNEGKSGVHYQGNTHVKVHGLRVNFPTPQMPQVEVNNIRAAVRQLEVLASQPNSRTSPDYRRLFERTSGRVNKLKRVGHAKYSRYRRVLKGILPLPSKKDLYRCVGLFDGVVADAAVALDTYHYYARYNRLQNRLNLVQRTYFAQAKAMRRALLDIRPTYNERKEH